MAPSPSHREPYGDQPVGLLQLEAELEGGRDGPPGHRPLVADLGRADHVQRLQPRRGLRRPAGAARLVRARLRRQLLGFGRAGRSAVGPTESPAAAPDPGDADDRTPVGATPAPSSTSTIYDFGQNMTGWTRLTVRGPAGSRVTVRHGHGLHPDGSLDNRSNMYSYADDVEFHLLAEARGERGFEDHGEDYDHHARQTDTYVLAGRGLGDLRAPVHAARLPLRRGLLRGRRSRARERRGPPCPHERGRDRELRVLRPAAQPDPQQRELDVRVVAAGLPAGRGRPVGAGWLARRPGGRRLRLHVRLGAVLVEVARRPGRLAASVGQPAGDLAAAMAPHLRRLPHVPGVEELLPDRGLGRVPRHRRPPASWSGTTTAWRHWCGSWEPTPRATC